MTPNLKDVYAMKPHTQFCITNEERQLTLGNIDLSSHNKAAFSLPSAEWPEPRTGVGNLRHDRKEVARILLLLFKKKKKHREIFSKE